MLKTLVCFAAIAGASCFQPALQPHSGRVGSLRPASSAGPSPLMMSADQDASKFSRRAVLSGFLFAALSTQGQNADAATEQDEIKRLQKEAARVQAVFDESLDNAVADMPSLKDNNAPLVDDLLVARGAPSPSPMMSGDETVAVLMQTMKDGGIQDNDAELKAVLNFASARNPIKRIPANLFVEELKNHDSQYSVLTSDYYTARIAAPEIKKKTTDEEVRSYLVSIEAPLPLLKSCSVPDQCIAAAASTSSGAAKPKEGSYFVTFQWQLSKSKQGNNCWMYDSCELMASASSAASLLPSAAVKTA